jgi:hypothetical protein
LYVVTDKELDSEIYFNEMFQLQQN